MRKLWILAVALLMSLSACGGGDPSPTEVCERAASVICSKLYECLTPTELAQIGYPPTEAECVTQSIVDSMCATATVDNACNGTDVYHPDQVDPCLSGLQSTSCTDFLGGTTPAACDLICQAP